MAGFQIPAGLLSERIGTPLVLAAGTALAGLGYCLAPFVDSYAALIVILLIAGLGASTQHPLASALVARAFAGTRSLNALGTYNFAGDLGKMAVPAAASLLVVVLPWRTSLALLGLIGLVAAIAILIWTPRFPAEEKPSADAKPDAAQAGGRGGFNVLLSIGVIDSATRMGFLTFLPFLLTAKGASLPTIGLALTLVFVGGAAGKLVCAWIGARIGVVATVWLTEGFTALGILALLKLPLEPSLMLLPLIGVALNGTSSVLYGSVPLMVTRRAAHPRVQHLLHRHDRIGRDRADPLRHDRRSSQRQRRARRGRMPRAHDAAARAGDPQQGGSRVVLVTQFQTRGAGNRQTLSDFRQRIGSNNKPQDGDVWRTAMDERRHAQRTRTLKAGKVEIDHRNPVLDCIVRNLSTHGALLLVPSMAVPDEFVLTLGATRTRHDCRVVWRAIDRVGVEFVSGGTADGAALNR